MFKASLYFQQINTNDNIPFKQSKLLKHRKQLSSSRKKKNCIRIKLLSLVNRTINVHCTTWPRQAYPLPHYHPHPKRAQREERTKMIEGNISNLPPAVGCKKPTWFESILCPENMSVNRLGIKSLNDLYPWFVYDQKRVFREMFDK